jgi:hypothetical protein
MTRKAKLLDGPRETLEISEALLHVAKPLLDRVEAPSRTEMEFVVMATILAWNAHLLGDKSQEFLDAAQRAFDERDVDPGTTSALFSLLLERRRELYPHDRRYVSNFEVAEKPKGGFHLSAIAMLR